MFITLYLKGGRSKVGAGLFSRVTSKKMAQVALGSLRLGSREKFFTRRVSKHWDILPREVIESPHQTV